MNYKELFQKYLRAEYAHHEMSEIEVTDVEINDIHPTARVEYRYVGDADVELRSKIFIKHGYNVVEHISVWRVLLWWISKQNNGE